VTLAPEEQSSAKILVPVSTFVDKTRLFRALQALSTKNPLVVLFRLVEVPRQTTPLDPDLWKEDIKEAEDFLAKPAMWLRGEGYRVETKVVTARDAAEGIIAEANNGGYTVVLLTKRRIRSGWGRIFRKSISEEVIRYTNTLVLTFLAEPQVEEMKR
jgi:nucleotide-binding universal stress UspA family protein